jgi:hypothetical protein
LIRHDLTRNRRVSPRRAPPRWVPPRRAPSRRWHRRPTGTDQGRWHNLLSTGPWNCRHQWNLSSRSPGHHYHHFKYPTPQDHKSILGGWPGHRGHHSIHGGRAGGSPCNRRTRKGIDSGGGPDKGHDGSLDHRPADYTLPQSGSTITDSPTLDEANPNPNGSGSGSPPRLSPLGNRIIRRVIRLPTSTRTRLAGHLGTFTDA